MRVAITDKGAAYTIPPEYPDGITPKWAYNMSPAPPALWACDSRPPLEGVEKITRVVEVPGGLTNRDFENSSPPMTVGRRQWQWQWLKDAAAAFAVLAAYALVLTVANRLDEWPLWACVAALTAVVAGMVGVVSLIARLREGGDIDP